MSERLDSVLIALRQIQRQTEMASRTLAATAKLTPSQLKLLQCLQENGSLSAGILSAKINLKHATITSLLDRLERNGMVSRQRCQTDRRKIMVTILSVGEDAIRKAPDGLQDKFGARYKELEDWEQAMLVAALERLSQLLDASDLDAAPILDIGELCEDPT